MIISEENKSRTILRLSLRLIQCLSSAISSAMINIEKPVYQIQYENELLQYLASGSYLQRIYCEKHFTAKFNRPFVFFSIMELFAGYFASPDLVAL
jgi:hypothetical protein